jgi:hypothetical protein
MWPLPEIGDIIWCRFPQRPRDLPGPKSRPALVLAVSDDDSVIKVAYGTSQHLNRMLSGEFAIRKQDNPSAYLLAGLSYDTKFDLRNIANIPWNNDFFEVPHMAPHGNNPKLGTLHACMMKACMSTAHAARNDSIE